MAADGIHALRNPEVEAGRGGVALGISMDLAPFINQEGITRCGRAVWICLDHPDWGRLGLLGVYGPNTSEERTALWGALVHILDDSYRWIMQGDFNMIDHPTAQWGGTGGVASGREGRAWAQLLRKFSLLDSFSPRRGHLQFSWDSMQHHRHNPANSTRPPGDRILRRIDRTYFAQGGPGTPWEFTSTILPGFAFSDHAHVWADLSMGPLIRRPSCHKMNPTHFSNPVFKERIVNMWEAGIQRGAQRGWTPHRIFQTCIADARTIDRCWGKRMACERRIRLDALQSVVAAAQLELERDPENILHQAALATAREVLNSFTSMQARWVDSIIQARWAEDGDRCSRIFFKQFKSLASAKEIPELLNEDGLIENTWEGMAQTATAFFSNIMGTRPAAPRAAAGETYLQKALLIQDQLLPLEKELLNAPLTLEELGEATSALANSKCPGPDGVPVEFYKANWHTVGPLILQCISDGIAEEHFPEKFTKGAIVLLKKKSDQRLLTNKRPITLLNTVYKIGAKAIQRRLSPILQRIITPQQSAFLPGRNIHHALLLMGEMLHQAKISGEEHILLKLDVCKAFDTLEWPFILATIERAGMNGILSGFLKAGFSSASSHIILNGRPTSAIRLGRSVRQGCPISLLIFILAFDNLSLMLSDAVTRGTLVGVRFPHLNTSNLQTMFADDTSVVIKAEMRYVRKIKEILEIFGEASGLHCIWEKTKAAFIP